MFAEYFSHKIQRWGGYVEHDKIQVTLRIVCIER
jgi:hypothetical protein